MLFSWRARRRRRRGVTRGAVPAAVWTAPLARTERRPLPAPLGTRAGAGCRDLMRVLVAEKQWLGRGGLFVVSEEMTVTIAAQAAACCCARRAEHEYFARVRQVIVFPTEFRTPVAGDDWEDDFLSDRGALGGPGGGPRAGPFGVGRGCSAWRALPGGRVQRRRSRVRPPTRFSWTARRSAAIETSATPRSKRDGDT